MNTSTSESTKALLQKAVIVDIDGTIALRSGRDPFEWQLADQDVPNEPVISVLRALVASGLSVIYVSGRPESARQITEDWISAKIQIGGELHLRPNEDFRRDSIVKREIFETLLQGKFDVVLVLDDRNQVVQMWRHELGLTCLQVADGDF